MKNDYKIGLVIGLLVLLLGVGYFIFRGPNKGKKTEAPITTIETTESDTSFSGEPTATDSSAGGSFTPPPPSVAAEPAPAPAAETVTVAPAAPAETVTVAPAPAKPADASLSERVGNWSTRTGNENAAPAATDTVAPRLGDEGTSGVAAVKPAPAPATDAGGEWGVPPVGGSVTTTNTPATTETPATYTVQPNDVGWYIAESVYGKGMGRYWSIIQAANPTVNSSNMKAGQVLKIPPLPDSARTRAQETAARGTMLTDDAGQRIYVTKSGDSLWTIAQNVYGKGHLYKEIQKANPKVDTNYLRPGLRLVIPEVAGAAAPTAADAADSTTTFGSETVTSVASSANNYYIVKSGDSLWTIAEKEYGDGNYSDIIKKANPNINPNNIRVGQKLVLPAKPEAGAAPVTSNGGGSSTVEENDPNATEDTPRESRPSRRSSSSESVPSDEPDFGL